MYHVIHDVNKPITCVELELLFKSNNIIMGIEFLLEYQKAEIKR